MHRVSAHPGLVFAAKLDPRRIREQVAPRGQAANKEMARPVRRTRILTFLVEAELLLCPEIAAALQRHPEDVKILVMHPN